MYLVIFGLSVSSSWGNGHATLWRALLKALARRGHRVVFYEKDVPYYASTRDGWVPPEGIRVRLYGDLNEVRREALGEMRHADVAMCTSYCADGPAACRLVLDSGAQLRVFYDLDTPVTLDALRSGEAVSYLPLDGLGDFDLVLSFTGGRALSELTERLGARAVAPLYGSVDPETHFPVPPMDEFRCVLSYLGTYAEDRQPALQELFLNAAERAPEQRFLIGGAQYPESFPWRENIAFARHLPPSLHPAFYCSSRATLNITRRAMAEYGYCPSGRLFEAAACGVPILSDWWDGLETFFHPGREIIRVDSVEDTMAALGMSDSELQWIARAARQRALTEHSADRRAADLEAACSQAMRTGVGLSGASTGGR